MIPALCIDLSWKNSIFFSCTIQFNLPKSNYKNKKSDQQQILSASRVFSEFAL